MGLSKELEQARAAEHLVVADLILKGYAAFLTDQGFPYDVIAETSAGMIRFQVKSTRSIRKLDNRPWKKAFKPYYMFHARRAGKGGKRIIQVGEFDAFVFVVLDTRTIGYFAYLKEIRRTLVFRERTIAYKRTGRKTQYFDELTLEKCLREIKDFRNGL